MTAFRIDITDRAIAVVTFDLEGEKINKLSTPVGAELEELLRELKENPHLKGLVLISGKPEIFIAGADIHEILAIHGREEGAQKSEQAQRLPNLIESLPFPTVAAIHGVCLGGGLELVLGCTYRIATSHPKTKLGLPEVQLGILPGMGGCYRLPKLIGLRSALEMILAGATWPADKALKRGLVNEVVPKEILLQRAEQAIEEKAWKKRQKRFSLLEWALEKNRPGRNFIYRRAKDDIIKRTRGHYPAPLKALEVIYEILDRGLTDGLKIESEGFGYLSETAVSKNLIDLFFQSEAIKKKTGVSDSSIQPMKIHSAAVVGAGVMGAGIAQLLADREIPVRLKDVQEQAVAKGLFHAAEIFEKAVLRKRLGRRDLIRKMNYISPSTEFFGFKKVDVVIEAVVEDLEIKRQLFETLESKVTDEAILATNTSSLSVSEIGALCKNKERLVGLHFFNPVHRMPLVEIVVDPVTSAKTVATSVQFIKELGKIPVVVKNAPGFLVNRILMPYLNEAAYLLSQGIPVSVIDETMLDFGMPMGPFTLLDTIGIDVAQKVAHILYRGFGERMKPHDILDRVVASGFYGSKNKKGFYIQNGKQKIENHAIYSALGLTPKKEEHISEEWQMRMVVQMIHEAIRCLEDGIVQDPSHLDLAMIYGIGFPPFRKGLLWYADQLGGDKVLSELDIFHRRYGIRFAPPNILKEWVRSGRKIYGN